MNPSPVRLLPEDPELLSREVRVQALKALTSKLAHDFNNFLTPILGYATLIKEAGGPGSAVAQYADAIERSGRKTEALLDAMMTAVRPERRSAAKETDLAGLFGALLDQWHAQLPPTIRVEVVRELNPCTVFAEPVHWQTAFEALLSNARNAMPSGGKLVVRLEPRTPDAPLAAQLGLAAAPSFVLTVADDGCGMTPETLAQCLNPLFSSGPRGAAAGLGLTAVHSAARLHGGQVVIASEPDQGTTVTVWFSALPREIPVAKPAAVVPTISAEPAASSLKRVLIVGCDATLHEALRARLQPAAYTVHGAADAAQARKLLSRYGATLALVIIEQQLPGMPGLEFAHQAAASLPETPIVLLTLGEELGDSARPAGRFAEIKKPFRWKGFWETVRKLGG